MDMNALARLGAQTRLAELASEMDSIVRAFPDLRPKSGARRLSGSANPAASEVPQRRTRKPRKLSAAARKRISDAQKARWANQRAAGAKK
jgi:hypothetical protein